MNGLITNHRSTFDRDAVYFLIRAMLFSMQMFVALGPGSFLAFGDVMCTVAALVFAALWYVGSKTPRHIGESIQLSTLCVTDVA